MKIGNFNIKEWIIMGISSNNDIIKDENERVQGTHWNPYSDCFHLNINLNFSKRAKGVRSGPNSVREGIPYKILTMLTKRMVMSQLNGIFDPLGLITPFTAK